MYERCHFPQNGFSLINVKWDTLTLASPCFQINAVIAAFAPQTLTLYKKFQLNGFLNRHHNRSFLFFPATLITCFLDLTKEFTICYETILIFGTFFFDFDLLKSFSTQHRPKMHVEMHRKACRPGFPKAGLQCVESRWQFNSDFLIPSKYMASFMSLQLSCWYLIIFVRYFL